MSKASLFLLFFWVMGLGLYAGGSQEVAADEIADTANAVEVSGIFLGWETAGPEIIFTLRAETTGWVSVGFDATRVMKDAQIILGYVENGKGYISDQFGTGTFTHKADTGLGGTDDVRLISASENGGVTELVFAVPVDSGDKYDVVLTPGTEHLVLLAHGPDGEDNSSRKHSARGKARVTF